MPSLKIQTGPARGRKFALIGQPQSIGRDGDIQILDTAASRRHAEVFQLDKTFFLRDLDSRNGTFLNDLKIEKETPLHPGDVIHIGSTLLVFEQKSAGGHGVEFVHDSGTATGTVEIGISKETVIGDGADKAKVSPAMARLFAMYQAALSFGCESSVQGVTDKVLDIAMAAVKPIYCYIFVLDETGKNLVPKAWRDPLRSKRRQISRAIVMRALQHGHSILTPDAATDIRFNQNESVVIGGIRSVLCAPLVARDRVTGVLYMGRDAVSKPLITTAQPEKTGWFRPHSDRGSVSKPFTQADLELATAIAFQAGIALENVGTQIERRTETVTIVKRLVGAMDLRAPEQRGHGERVGAYATAIADHLKLAAEEMEEVLLAALLHDAGKIHMTDNTLLAVIAALGQNVKPQYCHAILGAELIADLPNLAHVIPGIKYHHERLDGFGGPEGLSGEAVPLIARIVSVANRFDHLASDPLPTGRPMPISEAIETIEQPGEGLDDAVVHALVEAQKSGTGIQLPKLVLQEFC